MEKNFCYVASGDTMQLAFDSLPEAINAARYAPWSNGEVYEHACAVTDFVGFAELGGTLIYTAAE